MLHSPWTLALAVLACGAYFVQLGLQHAWPARQWDFLTYYHAARAWSAGDNPYELDALSRAYGQPVSLPYVYPPVTLWFFRAFTVLDHAPAAWLYLGLKLLALGALLWLWLRVFVRDAAGRMLLLVLCIHAFRRPLRVDLLAGNISIFEQLLVWSALACLLAGRRALFALLIALSACFKVVTLSLLPLAWVLRRSRSSLGTLALGVGLAAAVLLASALLQPRLFEGFRRNVAGLDERGLTNPASWAFIRDQVDALRERGVQLPRAAEPALYAGLVGVVGALAFARARRLSPSRDALQLLSLYLLAYGLLMPRFKDYSYALLLVPAVLVLRDAFRTRPLLALVALAAVLAGRFEAYLPLWSVAGLFVLACLPKRAGPPAAVALEASGGARPGPTGDIQAAPRLSRAFPAHIR